MEKINRRAKAVGRWEEILMPIEVEALHDTYHTNPEEARRRMMSWTSSWSGTVGLPADIMCGASSAGFTAWSCEGGGNMIKVTFRNQSGMYWVVCESLSYIRGTGYLLDSILNDSFCGGPHPWAKVPEHWKIILVEEA